MDANNSVSIVIYFVTKKLKKHIIFEWVGEGFWVYFLRV